MLSLHRIFYGFAWVMAMAGGIVLTSAILITCISIIGREVGLGAIRGDVELVEAGIAFAIFSFLPLCQITAGHASVDIFTNWLTGRPFRLLVFAIEVLFAVVLIFVALQLFEGTMDRYNRGQTSWMLQFPVWWAYAASLVSATAAAVVACWTALVRGFELLTNRDIIAAHAEAQQ
ncbi:MAG: TRAP-type C4-dicarboxylate transport system, small permease component [Rhodobacteraceae bacterium HLUCCA24]|nr:MAG: TRAP-type C4-dicarboxylate transport system, small permease component [Rhodobacteraceae bacterium HLUCCA24]